MKIETIERVYYYDDIEYLIINQTLWYMRDVREPPGKYHRGFVTPENLGKIRPYSFRRGDIKYTLTRIPPEQIDFLAFDITLKRIEKDWDNLMTQWFVQSL